MFEFLNKSDDKVLQECDVETVRGSGPGGTKADTTESTVRITHRPTDLTAKASERRSQRANKTVALRRLRLEYALEVRDQIDPDRVRIPEQLKQYRGNGIDINPKNRHFSFWVKLVLDVFVAEKGRLGPTADILSISTNQLVKFFGRDDLLWEKVNEIRETFDHGKLKQ